MTLKRLSINDSKALLAFECENKDWFERFIPPRPPEYFTLKGIEDAISELEKEQQSGECFMGVVYQGEEIIARANLNAIDGQTADIGYRVAEKHTGKGVATKAIAELQSIAKHRYNVSELTAHTTQSNEASQKVLLNQGFKEIKTVQAAVKINGNLLDVIFYQARLV